MSEYQFVHFAAVDRPLDDEQLEFMRRQSTRAGISRWEFSNEYHFGDFHGKADEMLRRGFSSVAVATPIRPDQRETCFAWPAAGHSDRRVAQGSGMPAPELGLGCFLL